MSVNTVSPPVAIAIEVESFDTDVQNYQYHPAANHQEGHSRWKSDLLGGCCEGGFLKCFLAFYCPLLVHAQVMERLGMTWRGSLPEVPIALDKRPIGIFMAYLLLVLVVPYLGMRVCKGLGYDDGAGVIALLLIAVHVWILIALVRARNSFRKAYNLPPVCGCGNTCVDDCCVTYFCGPCSALQMANHSFDNDVHLYEPLNRTGLSSRKDCQIVPAADVAIV